MKQRNTLPQVTSGSIPVLSKVPSDSETIDSVCQRMLKKYNMAPDNTMIVLDSQDYGPNPSGIVRGYGEPNYIIHNKSAVTEVFKEFVKDCKKISPMFAEHFLIPHKFRLRK